MIMKEWDKNNIDITDGLLQSLANSGDTTIAFKRSKSENFHVNFHEMVVFTQYGKFLISGFCSVDRSLKFIASHGFQSLKRISDGSRFGHISCDHPVLIGNHPYTFDNTQRAFSVDLSYARIKKHGRDSGTIIRNEFSSCYKVYKHEGFSYSNRICLTVFDHKNQRQICIRSFRKLPDCWVDWTSILKEGFFNK